MQTDFQGKVTILAELHANYRDVKDFQDFFEFNDIGLPLAYFVSEKLATANDEGARFIEETFDIFLDSLGIEDTGFEYLNEVFTKAAWEPDN